MNRFDQTMKAGLKTYLNFAGETITYFPQNEDVAPFPLRAARNEVKDISQGDSRRRGVSRGMNFEFFSSDLAENLRRKPRVGDWILDESGVRYDLVSIPGGLCYAYPTPEQILMMIHTVEAPQCP